MRCTKSVSIPAPVHYAHLAAYASRALRFEKDENLEGYAIIKMNYFFLLTVLIFLVLMSEVKIMKNIVSMTLKQN